MEQVQETPGCLAQATVVRHFLDDGWGDLDALSDEHAVAIEDKAKLAGCRALLVIVIGGRAGFARCEIAGFRAMIATVDDLFTYCLAAGSAAGVQDAKLIGHTTPVGSEENQDDKV